MVGLLSLIVVALWLIGGCWAQEVLGKSQHAGRGHAKHSKGSKKTPIPLLAVTLNEDRRRYLVRLLKSIDYPIDLIQITIGNSNATAVQEMVAEAKLGEMLVRKKFRNTHVHVITMQENPGAAFGFNVGLKYLQSTVGMGKGFEGVSTAIGVGSSKEGSGSLSMVENEFADRVRHRHKAHAHSVPQWSLVVNADISFYPGILSTLAEQVEFALATDDSFGIGFTSLCCGSEWSAVVFTTKVASQAGLMDENFYPAYYEDEDYGIRVRLSGLKAVKFEDTPMHHGELDGSKDYLSGLFDELYLNPKQDEASQKWRKSHQRGVQYAHSYLEKKWGVEVGHFDSRGTFHSPPNSVPKLDCKSVEGINGKCHPVYKAPFNNQSMVIKDWSLNAAERAKITAD